MVGPLSFVDHHCDSTLRWARVLEVTLEDVVDVDDDMIIIDKGKAK